MIHPTTKNPKDQLKSGSRAIDWYATSWHSSHNYPRYPHWKCWHSTPLFHFLTFSDENLTQVTPQPVLNDVTMNRRENDLLHLCRWMFLTATVPTGTMCGFPIVLITFKVCGRTLPKFPVFSPGRLCVFPFYFLSTHTQTALVDWFIYFFFRKINNKFPLAN